MMKRHLLIALAILVGGLAAYAGLAQPVRRVVLNELRIEEVGGCQRITTGLQFPLSVAGHSPERSGTQLQVRVTPLEGDRVALSDLLTREALAPASGIATALRQVTWEGDAPGGPMLVYQFSREVAYDVTSGSDFRSIVVTLHPVTQDPAPCTDASVPAQGGAK